MAQTILIGLGGTGSRTVNNVAKILNANGERINEGGLCCAVLDTNDNDNKYIEATGTGVPVIPTSKAQNIGEYLEEYSYLNMEEWCPSSPAFLEESMIDGASEIRVKSRIAFMDCVKSGTIKKLETMINKVVKNDDKSKIRIMIVSSISGGTGSGSFIQVALWLRKHLDKSQITIRGIFLLPDVFVSSIEDIRKNKTTTTRHYCNAYAAIRELNTITKIKKSGIDNLPERLALDGLFDSETDSCQGKPVYDFAFFIDDVDKNGVKLDDIGQYEELVAQLVYMQMHAPMKDDMYSEEDNAFLSFVDNEEPLYGSCGTSRAIYPVDSIRKYCVCRAVSDSLSDGWRKLDEEIEALRQEKEDRESEGIYSGEEFAPRTEYIRLFDKKIETKEEKAGKDRFFLTLFKDVKNERRHKGDDDKIAISYTDKVDDFIKLLKTSEIEKAVLKYSGTDDYYIEKEAFVASDNSEEDILDRVKKDESGLEEALDTFDKNADEYASTILDSLLPYNMDEVSANNKCSIYGLLTKKDETGKVTYVHPVAARYLLYKLVAAIEKGMNGIVLEHSRTNALSGGEVGTQFDNEKTSETETDPKAYLESKKWYQRKEAFIDNLEGKYAEFINSKIELCLAYERDCLLLKVYGLLKERVNGLILHMEAFFESLTEVQKKMTRDISENLRETKEIEGKTLFVCANEFCKEKIYSSLNFGAGKGDSKINKSVIDSVYGCYCAEKRPNTTANKRYANVDIATAFLMESIGAYIKRIDEDPNNSKKVNMDIYTALCRESDFCREDEEAGKSSLDRLDISTGKIKADTTAEENHRDEFEKFKDKLYGMAAPFLDYDRELPRNALGETTSREKTFWGFSSKVNESCPYVGAVLGINADLQADDGYNENELYCYRAVYGLEAKYIPKFNEMKNGLYYKCYKSVISEMVKAAAGKKKERAYVSSPHLDKNWHKFLPYVTSDKQYQSELDFYHGVWLAIAYGIIRADNDGRIEIKRSVDGGNGNFIDEIVPLMYNKKQLTKTDVPKIIDALKADELFINSVIYEVEKRYQEEIAEIDTYVGTEVLKGLTTKKEDLNPINFVCRYNEDINHDIQISANLISALETIAKELVEKYNTVRSEEKIDEAKFRLCKRIYDSSTRVKGRALVFSRWEAAFKDYKFKETGATEE